jgi:cellulose synthase/poly-beta-1,6-N-acetylglucosamine synthase-like glycosyltransferase
LAWNLLSRSITANGMSSLAGISFVVPVRNGEASLERMLAAVLAQRDGRDVEIIAVDDGSRDRSRAILDSHAGAGRIKVVDGGGEGAAAAINRGIRHAAYPIICQVDQDVILHPAWLARLSAALEVEDVAAAQGYYVAPGDGSIWSRVMGLDLEQRYSQIRNLQSVNHVCTGNVVYRASALAHIGLLDEDLGYGYDNDVSYRLVQAGYRLVICPQATSTHEWRDDLWGYVRQQYGFGYGRLDLIAKHRRRFAGDDVSRLQMIVHAPIMALAVVGLVAAAILKLVGYASVPVLAVSAGLIGLLAAERFAAGILAIRRFGKGTGLLFPVVHLVRDLAWTAAIAVWVCRRLRGRSARPAHSMRPREAKTS